MRPIILATTASWALACAPEGSAPGDRPPASDPAADAACLDVCDDDERCRVEDGEPTCVCAPGLVRDGAACVPACDTPAILRLPALRTDDRLPLTATDGLIEVAVVPYGAAVTEADFVEATDLDVSGHEGVVRAVARVAGASCSPVGELDELFVVGPTYPGDVDAPDGWAVAADDPTLIGWATGVAEVSFGSDVDDAWRTSDHALGPAASAAPSIVSLGRGGQITLTFADPIADGPGAELAVFENGFSNDFLEVATLAVSSDGDAFVTFPHAMRSTGPKAPFDLLDPTTFTGLAGKHRQGWGTPFDLGWLAYTDAVRAGLVDLAAVTHVRLTDVVGDGQTLDSLGQPIHDPFPTVQSAGFDLDAVGVLAPTDAH